jgi:hypothetical protein
MTPFRRMAFPGGFSRMRDGRCMDQDPIGTQTRKAIICAGMSRNVARARPQPPPGRVERLGPTSFCAVKETGGLWDSLARPDRPQCTFAAHKKCPSNVEHLSKNCNENRYANCPELARACPGPTGIAAKLHITIGICGRQLRARTVKAIVIFELRWRCLFRTQLARNEVA